MIRVAVVGAGHWGPNLVRNFIDAHVSDVCWVVDTNRARVEEVARHYPNVAVATDPRIACADERVDAVVVATPTATHYEIVKMALEHGKHVLVEKPLTADIAEAEELCALADRLGLVLMVGHVFLFNEGVREVKRLVDDGTLGRVYYVSMVRTNLGPIRADVNAAWDLAAHDLAIANYWLGAQPEAASATGGSWVNKGIEDTVFTTLRYPEDVLVNMHVSWLDPRKVRLITVVGERRMLTFDDMSLQEPIRIYDKGVEGSGDAGITDTFAAFRSSVREGSITIPRVKMGEPLRAECAHFLDCIESGQRPTSSGWEGLSVVCALEAMGASMRNGGREERVVGVASTQRAGGLQPSPLGAVSLHAPAQGGTPTVRAT